MARTRTTTRPRTTTARGVDELDATVAAVLGIEVDRLVFVRREEDGRVAVAYLDGRGSRVGTYLTAEQVTR